MAQVEAEKPLWVGGLRLLLEHHEITVADPSAALCVPAAAFVRGCYMSDGVSFFLGTLLTLWRHSEFRARCPACGGSAYMIKVGGSELSGNWVFEGVCVDCESWVGGPGQRRIAFSDLMRHAFRANAALEASVGGSKGHGQESAARSFSEVLTMLRAAR